MNESALGATTKMCVSGGLKNFNRNPMFLSKRCHLIFNNVCFSIFLLYSKFEKKKEVRVSDSSIFYKIFLYLSTLVLIPNFILVFNTRTTRAVNMIT